MWTELRGRFRDCLKFLHRDYEIIMNFEMGRDRFLRKSKLFINRG